MLKKVLDLKKKLNIAFCVLSSDSYKDIWDLFYFYYKKNFSQYQIPIYFISSEKNKNLKLPYKVIFPKKYNSKDPWSNRICECIKLLNYKNIITTTEDAIINKKVSSDRFFYALNYFSENKLDYLKISPFFPNKSEEKINTFIKHSDWELHRINMTKALWKKDALLSLFKKNETFKEFDMFASIRARNKNLKVQHCNFTTISYLEIINGGKFNFLSKKILLNFKNAKKIKRSFSSFSENIFNRFNYFKTWIYSILPIFLKKFLISNKIIGYEKRYQKKL